MDKSQSWKKRFGTALGHVECSLGNKSTKQPGSAGSGMTRETLGNGVKTDNQKTTSRSKQEKREP